MDLAQCLALAVLATAGCAHVDVQAPSVCDGAHFTGAGANKVLAEVIAPPPPQSLSLETTFSAGALPGPGSLSVELSPLLLTVQGGTWSFADTVTVAITGSDPGADPTITVSDYKVTPADATANALSLPIGVPSATLVAYLRDGPITLTLGMTAHAAPPGDIDLQICHSESGSWSWNVVNGTS